MGRFRTALEAASAGHTLATAITSLARVVRPLLVSGWGTEEEGGAQVGPGFAWCGVHTSQGMGALQLPCSAVRLRVMCLCALVLPCFISFCGRQLGFVTVCVAAGLCVAWHSTQPHRSDPDLYLHTQMILHPPLQLQLQLPART